MSSRLILAPLRGVTIRCFRETFSDEIRAAGFTEAITPFVAAQPGLDPLKDRELRDSASSAGGNVRITPQFIGKDPESLRFCLARIRSAGYETADLNCGCPFPMVRKKGRGSGILRTPDVLRRMLDVGCEVMGPGRFSVKTRLGVDRPDELLALLPLLNAYPLRQLTVHARTARQMYEGACDREAFDQIAAEAKIPLVYNGDLTFPLGVCPQNDLGVCPQNDLGVCPQNDGVCPQNVIGCMVGRGFVRYLGEREDSRELLLRYLEASRRELGTAPPVLGRLKELLSYWGQTLLHGGQTPSFGGQTPVAGRSRWVKRWPVIKVCRSLEELKMVI